MLLQTYRRLSASTNLPTMLHCFIWGIALCQWINVPIIHKAISHMEATSARSTNVCGCLGGANLVWGVCQCHLWLFRNIPWLIICLEIIKDRSRIFTNCLSQGEGYPNPILTIGIFIRYPQEIFFWKYPKVSPRYPLIPKVIQGIWFPDAKPKAQAMTCCI